MAPAWMDQERPNVAVDGRAVDVFVDPHDQAIGHRHHQAGR